MIVPDNTKLGKLRAETAMKTLFAEGEIKVLKKIMNRAELSKSEREWYSRKIKKRINAMIDFYEMAVLLRKKD